jgi:putative ABC transport system permease protein
MVGTVIAIVLGTTTAVFAVGLAISLSRAADGISRTEAVPVELDVASVDPLPNSADADAEADWLPKSSAVVDAIRQVPGTGKVVGVREENVVVVGLTKPVLASIYNDDASWLGHQLIAGRWYTGSDEIVAGSYLLRQTGRKVGDHLTVTANGIQRRVQVVGEVFTTSNGGLAVYAGAPTMAGLQVSGVPMRWEIGLTPGTDPDAYATVVAPRIQHLNVYVAVRGRGGDAHVFSLLVQLVTTLAALLCAVAALGVFYTVLLNTRERMHEIGVLKAVGMTPWQVRLMVVASIVGLGVVGGLIAVPLGYALHQWLVPVMADSANTRLPDNVLGVFVPLELIGLGSVGVVLAVLGALVPAAWTVRMPVAAALRAE